MKENSIEEAKRLFEAIMKIADERDKIKQEYDRDTYILQNQLDLANAKNIEKDKIIDLMAEELVKAHEWFYSEFDNYTKEDFIKYFERKVEEDK